MQIRGITSEALEAKIRQLFPSQNGFTEELSAQSLIVPTVDLTPTAEGTDTPEYLQRAISFGGITSFEQVGAGTTTIVATPGFYQLLMSATVEENASNDNTVKLTADEGATTKVIWQLGGLVGTSEYMIQQTIDQVFFLPSGISLKVTCSTNAYTVAAGSIRQVATVGGSIVLPSGFTPE